MGSKKIIYEGKKNPPVAWIAENVKGASILKKRE